MPEGDTIHHAANRIRPLLEGRVPDAIQTPHPRHRLDRWPERLAGRAVISVDAYGKHLFLRWEGEMTIHSHLGMTGAWGVYRTGARWGRSPQRAWLIIGMAGSEATGPAQGADVVQFDGPVLELMTESRTRFDQRLAALGPDILAASFDEVRFLRRLRGDDPTRPIGDALLDQRTVAGIGNIWKCEGCFLAGVDPWRPVREVTDDEALSIVRAARPRMAQSARGGHRAVARAIYHRAGRPCPRCGSPIRESGQGDGNRPTYWCAECQR